MSTPVSCACGFRGDVPVEFVGRTVHCPKCGRAAAVPNPEPTRSSGNSDYSLRCLRWAADRPAWLRWTLIGFAVAFIPAVVALVVRTQQETVSEFMRNNEPIAVLERLDMRVRGVGKPYESFRWKLSLARETAGEEPEHIVTHLSRVVENLNREGRYTVPWLLLKDAVNGCEAAGKGVGIGDFLNFYEHHRQLDQDHNEACRETEKILKNIAARKRSGAGI